MTKKILLSVIVASFTFSGCLSTQDVKPDTQKATKAIDKVESNTTKATTKAKKAVSKIESVADSVKNSSTEVTPPPESSLKDKAIEKAVEVADEHTNGAASEVIESVK